ncbi:MAG: PIN domain-containing protein [Candidatus Bathyarchaeia archaeon]
MKVLDSDILVALLRNDRNAIEKLRELNETEGVITTTIFNEQEIIFGALLTEEANKNFKTTKELLDSFDTLCYGKEDMCRR